jgi:GNAT superfamily N-acetyltransferase
MWHTAAFWDPDRFVLAEDDALAVPELAAYIVGWGRDGDVAIVAIDGDRRLGAVWHRLFPADRPGYGFVDEAIPELALAVRPDARGRGVGASLLAALVRRARDDGRPGLSLSVSDGNPSRRLYDRAGFQEVGHDGSSATMVLRFDPLAP